MCGSFVNRHPNHFCLWPINSATADVAYSNYYTVAYALYNPRCKIISAFFFPTIPFFMQYNMIKVYNVWLYMFKMIKKICGLNQDQRP